MVTSAAVALGGRSRYLERMDTSDIAMDHEVVVIGAGFSGIGAAIKLDQAGFRDFVVLEAGDGVGGAWHWNTYPGIAVDIPSFSYQFSFEKCSDWSRVYAPGMELKAYAEHCVDKYGVRDRIQLNTKVVGARFDEDAHVVAHPDRERRADHRAIRGWRDRRVQPAQTARDRGPRLLRRDDHAHGALGSLGRPARQARRGDRHRCLGDPADPRDRP